jgi:hypothetical protein
VVDFQHLHRLYYVFEGGVPLVLSYDDESLPLSVGYWGVHAPVVDVKRTSKIRWCGAFSLPLSVASF